MSKIVSTEEYLALPRAPETWLIEPLLPKGGALLLYGDPKIGKSFAALQMAECLTSATNWLGFDIPNHHQNQEENTPDTSHSSTGQSRPHPQNRVVYIQLDTPRSLWAERLEKLRAASHHPTKTTYTSTDKSGWADKLNQQPSSETPQLPSLLSRIHWADRDTLETWPFDILRDDHQVLLKSILDPIAPDVVILDTLREAHSGDENDSTVMQNVIARLTAAVNPAALVLISHSRKSNHEAGPDLMNDPRGSSYVVGKMDGIVRFSYSSMRVSGRAIDEQSIPIVREDNGFWNLASDPLRKDAEILLADAELSTYEMARRLHDMTGKSESACRAYLRRMKAKREKK